MPGIEKDGYGGAAVGGRGASLLFPLRKMTGGLWVLGHLLYLSLEDMKERQVSMAVILELGGSGIFHIWASGKMPQLLPGVLLLFLAFAGQEKIGYGDGWLLLALGMWLELRELLWMFFFGTGLLVLWAVFFHKKELPLVPFWTVAYIIGVLL